METDGRTPENRGTSETAYPLLTRFEENNSTLVSSGVHLNIPPPPTISSPTDSSLDINPDRGMNPDNILLAVYDRTRGKYLTPNGGTSSAAVWMTESEWGRFTVGGLDTATVYEFAVKVAVIIDRPKGDVDMDGEIDVMDALAVVRHTAGRVSLTGEQFCQADCNDDGRLDITDIMGIVQAILGKGECRSEGCNIPADTISTDLSSSGIGCTTGGTPYARISVSQYHLTDYGLQYPVTYVFTMPAQARGLTIQYCHRKPLDWIPLPTKTASDLFNGIECARFDYANDSVYVSVRFGVTDSVIYLRAVDGLNFVYRLTYQGIPTYYDARRMAVTWSLDDWGSYTRIHREQFTAVCSLATTKRMPVTFSCNPDTVYYAWQYHYPDWHSLTNAWIDSGYTFVAAHGLRHRRSTDIGFTYESEIGACKTMLIADLNLPYSRGQTEYLVGWVSPYGQAGNEWADTLGLHKYLAYIAGGWDQSFDEHHFGRFPGWINTLNGFQVYDYQNGMEGFIEYEPSCAKMNADFEVCKARGWIYHKRGHVRFDYSWVDTTGHFSDDILCHFEHISGDTTVWYVDLNGLYLYHFVQERNLVAISNVGEHSPSFVFLTRQSNGSI